MFEPSQPCVTPASTHFVLGDRSSVPTHSTSAAKPWYEADQSEATRVLALHSIFAPTTVVLGVKIAPASSLAQAANAGATGPASK